MGKPAHYNTEHLHLIYQLLLLYRASTQCDNTSKVCVKCLVPIDSVWTHKQRGSNSNRRRHVDIQSGEFTPNCVLSQVAADQ